MNENNSLESSSEKKVFLKKEATGLFGHSPEERTIGELLKYSIVNLDKPKGPTSHQVSDYVQNIFGLAKAGHSGTLDPGVTGVQPTALGRATRIAQFLLTAPKEYVCLMHIHKDLGPGGEERIRLSFQKFVGKIQQMPPQRSAIKRQLRTREIYDLKILEIKGQDVFFSIKCQAGTYIRKVCLHPQTEILTNQGPLAASQFFLNHSNVYSYNLGKIIEKTPSAVQKIVSPKTLIKIMMSSGVSIIVTPDHKLLSSLNGGPKMVEAQTLKKGDYLFKSLYFPNISKEHVIVDLLDDNYLIQQKEIKEQCKQAFISKYGSIREMYRHLKLDRKAFLSKANCAITIKHLKLAGIYEQVKNEIYRFKTQKGSVIEMKELKEDLFYLLGLIASDGNNTKEKKTERYTRIKFHNNEEILVDNFVKVYKELFPDIPISKRKITEKLWQLDTSNSFLATIAASLGIKSPQKESSLSPIINLNENFIRSFLRGYFEGDGSVYYKKTINNDKSKIILHTISPADALNLHKMLLKVGIHNRILKRNIMSLLINKKCVLYDVTIANIPSEKKFIIDIGTTHPKKARKFQEIINLSSQAKSMDNLYIGFHYKKYLRENKSKLHDLGGNLSRVLNNNNIPITRAFYKKALNKVNLPSLDEFIIEKVDSIETIPGTDFVYDLTVPETHNFLIETGFVSSNCTDFGRVLGVSAHMFELRRTQAGPFTEKDNLVTLSDLEDAHKFYLEEKNDKFLRYCLQPIEKALKYIPKCWVLDTTIKSLTHGRDLGIPGISKMEEFSAGDDVALLTLKGELIAMGQALMSTKEIMSRDKGLALKVKKVFMEGVK